MKNESKSPIYWAIGIIAFFGIALFVSQHCFTKQFNASLKEIASIRGNLDSLAISLDSINNAEQILAIQKARLDVQKAQYEIELSKQKQQLFWYNISFLGIGTILGFVTLLFWIPKEIEKRAKLEVDEKIGDAIRGRSETVRYLLNTYDKESFLRQNKRIYITGGTDKEKVRGILMENGINPENVYLDEDTAKSNKYDILFFNNLNNELLPAKPQRGKNGKEDDEEKYNEEMRKYNEAFQAILKAMQAEKQSVCFFYYNETNVIFPIWEIRDYDLKKRINFATNPAQIYGNLLNTLKYQDKISQNR